MSGVVGPRLSTVFENQYSFDFDGTDAEFVGAVNYDNADGTTKMTISAWINIENSTTNSYLVSVIGINNFSFAVRLQTITNTVCHLYTETAGNNNRASTNLGNIKNTGWHHLLICLDLSLPTFTECQIYLDGVAQTMTGYYAASVLPNATGPLTIGNSQFNTGTNWYGGKVDEIAIWVGEDLRSQDKVNEIYELGLLTGLNKLPTIPQPTTWFRMGDTSTFSNPGGSGVWIMTDVNGGYTVTSSGIAESDRITDTP